jgi:hypothetical protein
LGGFQGRSQQALEQGIGIGTVVRLLSAGDLYLGDKRVDGLIRVQETSTRRAFQDVPAEQIGQRLIHLAADEALKVARIRAGKGARHGASFAVLAKLISLIYG